MPNDLHAIMVSQALRKKNHEGYLWFTADFPTQQHHTFAINSKSDFWDSSGIDFGSADFDVVWKRRAKRPILSPQINDDDVDRALMENMAIYDSFWCILSQSSFWINPIESAKKSNSKIFQLKTAKKIGLNIPDSIISNAPQEIRSFIAARHDVVYKPLTPMVWFEDEQIRTAYTKKIKESDLPSDFVLQNTPGIFQEKINKKYELRLTFMGNTCIAIKIDSQAHPDGVNDWREIPHAGLKISPYNLPDAIRKKCREMMQNLGLVFGCFDFIVTPDDEYYFLEVNEQGQFLWLENINPEIKVLDAFTNFLISGSPEFVWKQSECSLYMSDFKAEAQSINESLKTEHLEHVQF